MEKYKENFRALRFVVRLIIPRNYRCHKRRIFFEKLFENLREVRDGTGNHVSGYIQCNESSYRNVCHDLAADISYYPFDSCYPFMEKDYIYVGEFFNSGYPQSLYDDLKVKIIRKSSLWKVFFKYGEYEVEVIGTDYRRIPINFNYTKKMKLP